MVGHAGVLRLVGLHLAVISQVHGLGVRGGRFVRADVFQGLPAMLRAKLATCVRGEGHVDPGVGARVEAGQQQNYYHRASCKTTISFHDPKKSTTDLTFTNSWPQFSCLKIWKWITARKTDNLLGFFSNFFLDFLYVYHFCSFEIL